MSDPRVVISVEGRIASTRLPGKILYPLAGRPMIEQIVRRAKRAERVHEVLVATTVNAADQVVVDLCHRIGCKVHQGSVEDISERILGAAGDADIIVQITGDCPLVDPALIDHAVALLVAEKADYVSNSLHECTYPIGFDVRAFTSAALRKSMELSDDPIDRVHGSYFIARRPDLFKHVGWEAPDHLRYPGLRLTVDEPSDYALVHKIYETLHQSNEAFAVEDIIALIHRNPAWAMINAAVQQKQASEG
ncbi:glycosyltransferase family protein [Rhodoferax saidenbachensis]|uniref:Spore coat polysaccharide biosynthesis protein SpsF n=1 Tax=Rhodoferax saidenbachensis TaxID=1484693 RepID=A0ABU1ZKF8_9BURK|nr:glycosyltransferase family protein [Rhodoferax saidenbachensis]MDR7306036.1 spore coat polysaccharide biosynthesis protein SpsF [Rhodoferax saidenbachensis]